MEGFTPRELWIQEQRAITSAMETSSDVPVPSVYGDTALFSLFREPTPRLLAAVENALATALGVTFAGSADGKTYELTAKLPSGRKVKISTLAEAVAEQRVTGTAVVTEWVRLPAESAEVVAA